MHPGNFRKRSIRSRIRRSRNIRRSRRNITSGRNIRSRRNFFERSRRSRRNIRRSRRGRSSTHRFAKFSWCKTASSSNSQFLYPLMMLVAQVVAGRLPKIAGCQLIKLSRKEPGNVLVILGSRPATTCATSIING